MLYKTNFAEGVGRQVHQRELQTSSNDLCEVYCVEPGKICQLKVNKIKNLKPNKKVCSFTMRRYAISVK